MFEIHPVKKVSVVIPVYNIIISTRLFTLNTFIKLLHKNSEY